MANKSTYILLPRDFYNWRWYKDVATEHLYMYLILSANTEDGSYRTVEIKRGQIFTTLDAIVHETGLTIQQVRTAIRHLVKTGEIKCETHPYGRLITVTNFEQFMEDDA